jgi:hypothetical protein
MDIFRFFRIAAIATGFFASTACHRAPQSDPQTLVVAISSQPNTLDPRFATDAIGQRIASLLFSFVQFDRSDGAGFAAER